MKVFGKWKLLGSKSGSEEKVFEKCKYLESEDVWKVRLFGKCKCLEIESVSKVLKKVKVFEKCLKSGSVCETNCF